MGIATEYGVQSDHTPGARELRSRLPVGRRDKNSVVALGILIINLFAYIVAFYFAHTAGHLGVRLAAAIVVGFVISFLFIIGHDACHGSFVQSKYANRLIARLCFMPSAQPYSSWVLSHNGHHHGWTNLRGKDPAFAPFSKAEYDMLPRYRQWLERLYRSPFGLGIFYLVEVWYRLEMFPSNSFRPKNERDFAIDRTTVILFAVGQFLLAYLLASNSGVHPDFAVVETTCLLAVSYAVWFNLAGFVTFQQHTHYRIPWFNSPEQWNFFQGQVHCSPHIVFPTWVNRLFLNVMDHAVHHVDPLVPLYRLPSSQISLHRATEGHLETVHWSVSEMLRVLRRCRLYDFEQHQWLDYDGTPTSESGLHRLQPIGVSQVSGS